MTNKLMMGEGVLGGEGMKVRDLMRPEGRVFMKSEWGRISDDWPCVSFTKPSVGNRLRADFEPGRDVLIYVGTTNAEMTENPDHRARLISAVVIQPGQVLETKKIVPPEVWTKSVAQWGNRWPLSMAVVKAANIIGPPFPHAHDVAPAAYRSFSELPNRGSVVEARGAERDAVMNLDIEEITLTLTGDVQQYIEMRKALAPDLDKAIKQEAFRMAELIQARVVRGGEPTVRINPQRTAPNISDLVPMLVNKWTEQQGQCTLCGGPLVPKSPNPMLQPSADRIDSDNGSYGAENVQVTHLACNLAKNQYGSDQFTEWLDVVRSGGPISDS